ncbi:MAG: protelomerase family protein [Cyanobacteria bacterium J06632_19]
MGVYQQTHITIMSYNELSKKKLIAIAKERKIPRYSVIAKKSGTEELIKLLEQWDMEQSTETTETTDNITFTSVPTSKKFFEYVTGLDDKLKVEQACNALLDIFAEKYTPSTISRKLSEYRKPFYAFKHSNKVLNETVDTKDGLKIQHIAGRKLSLTDDQHKELGTEREQGEQSRAGFTTDGDIRKVEKPKIDITAVIKKSCECLHSSDPYTIGVGIVNLTGLRANEQNQPKRSYPKWGKIVEREMVVIDEYVIGFKGLSKKRSLEDANTFYARATLAPAQLIVDAQKRFLASPKVKSIPADYESYRKGFMDTFNNRFHELFGETLSTVEAYDDDSNLTKDNGSSHRGRAFYSCALRAILKAEMYKDMDSAASKYIQLSVAHETVAVTIRYLGRYNESDFINPIDIGIPDNIKELGKMDTAVIERAKTTDRLIVNATLDETKKSIEGAKEDVENKKPTKDSFDIDAFISGLDADLQVKFAELMNSETDLTSAVLSLINITQSTAAAQSTKRNKPSVTDEVREIIAGIMDYNSQQTENTNCVVPTYTLVNKLAIKTLEKEVHRKAVNDVLEELNDDIATRLSHKEITGLDIGKWNGKHHRKDMKSVIDKIVNVLNQQ